MPSPAPIQPAEPRARPARRARWLWPALLLLAFALQAAWAIARVGQAFDEQHYLVSARELVAGRDWRAPLLGVQPPLGLYLPGLFTLGLPEAELAGEVSRRALVLGRLGVLPGGLLCLALVYLWCSRALSRRAGLLALLLCALQPMLVGYASLVAVDAWHAATSVLLGLALWRLARAPSAARQLAAGAALGLVLATKYFALLDVPIAAGVVCLASARARSGAERVPAATRARRALLGLALCAAAALVTLHACYGFRAGFAGLQGDASWTARAPGLRWAAALLPEPYVRGVQFGVDVGTAVHPVYLNGRFAPGHPSYYLWCLALKSPLAWLAACGLALALRARAWLHGRADERWLAAIALALGAAELAALSLGTSFQLGIRYVLPEIALASCAAACLARTRGLRALGTRARRAGFALLALALALDVLPQASNPIAYFQPLGGGPARAWRHFADSNCDWEQARRSGAAELRARYGDALEILHAGDGPRFGRVAAYALDLAQPDPLDPSRARHWLDAFEPSDHCGAAWLVFELEAADFERVLAAEPDARRAADFAFALLGARELESARALAPQLPPEPRALLAGLAAQLEAPPSPQRATALVHAWLQADRPDESLRAAESLDELQRATLRAPLALAELRLAEPARACARLAAVPAAELSGLELLLYARALQLAGSTVGALELLEAHAAALRAELPQQAEAALLKARNAVALLPEWVRAVQREAARAAAQSEQSEQSAPGARH